jgi:hypothetical protein
MTVGHYGRLASSVVSSLSNPRSMYGLLKTRLAENTLERPKPDTMDTMNFNMMIVVSALIGCLIIPRSTSTLPLLRVMVSLPSRSLMINRLDVSKLVIEKGANLFMKNNDGVRAIDISVNRNPCPGSSSPAACPRPPRWSSVKHLLLISNFYETSDVVPFSSSSSSSSSSAVVPQTSSFIPLPVSKLHHRPRPSHRRVPP